MTTYNEKNVISFLISLTFSSLTVFIYTRRALVAKEFGCTLATAAKWIDRAESTGLITATKNGFVMTDLVAAKSNREKMAAVQAGVDSGKVVRLASVRCENLRKKHEPQSTASIR